MLSKTLKFLLVASIGFCFCASSKDMIKPDPQKIDAYLQAHPDLPVTDKTSLEEGRFEIGIQKETLLFLLGEPPIKEMVKQPWAMQEKWIYKKGGRKVFIIEEEHVVGILEN